ncbi:MAG: sulfur carrier protein ThiS adenylyltransferase ThiF [Rectinema subterraneum]|jgi:sulfur carrier protein ThiS adenylyltransferase
MVAANMHGPKTAKPGGQAKGADFLARNPPALEHIAGKRVGIIGLGGLGSNIAMMLARAGITSFRLADFDTVSLENLNRQHYFSAHVGQAKTEALASQLEALNPGIELELWPTRIEEEDLDAFAQDCDVLVEAVDDAATKAMIYAWFRQEKRALWLVTASGLGGLEPANTIRTMHLAGKVIACGDFETSSENGNGVCAPRVMLVAAHQALAVLRTLAGLELPE